MKERQLRVNVGTSLYADEYQEVIEHGWVINDLIRDGIRYRKEELLTPKDIKQIKAILKRCEKEFERTEKNK